LLPETREAHEPPARDLNGGLVTVHVQAQLFVNSRSLKAYAGEQALVLSFCEIASNSRPLEG
jgi:hypothetical protein